MKELRSSLVELITSATYYDLHGLQNWSTTSLESRFDGRLNSIEASIEKYAKDYTIKELKKLRTTVEAKNYGTDMWHLIDDKMEELK